MIATTRSRPSYDDSGRFLFAREARNLSISPADLSARATSFVPLGLCHLIIASQFLPKSVLRNIQPTERSKLDAGLQIRFHNYLSSVPQILNGEQIATSASSEGQISRIEVDRC